jgi:hypothetical protein
MSLSLGQLRQSLPGGLPQEVAIFRKRNIWVRSLGPLHSL